MIDKEEVFKILKYNEATRYDRSDRPEYFYHDDILEEINKLPVYEEKNIDYKKRMYAFQDIARQEKQQDTELLKECLNVICDLYDDISGKSYYPELLLKLKERLGIE